MSIEEQYQQQIIRYLRNELTEAEANSLFEWLYENPEREAFFYSLKDIWENSVPMQTSSDTNREWNTLLSRIKTQKKTGQIRKLSLLTLKIAASLIIVFSLGYSTFHLLRNEPVEFNEIITQKGEKSKLTLADGTEVWLNSETKFRYPTNVHSHNVTVFLNGEAFFKVHKNPKRKFNVNTSSINIQVVGTSFNLKAYESENTVKTTLVEGKILIDGKIGETTIKNPIELHPNQQATLVKQSGQINISEQAKDEPAPNRKETTPEATIRKIKPQIKITNTDDTDPYTAWKDNRMVFRKEAFEDLAVTMERWYNVKIKINDEELKKTVYSGTFDQETIEQALKALRMIIPFDYTIDKNTIEINRSTRKN